MTDKALLIRNNIKNNLRSLREANNLKMRDVANALGIKENTYRVWEDKSKDTVPKTDSMVEISKIFNVSIDFLTRSESENKRNSLSFSASTDNSVYGDKYLNELTNEEKIAVMKLRRLSSADRQKIIKDIDNIIKNND